MTVSCQLRAPEVTAYALPWPEYLENLETGTFCCIFGKKQTNKETKQNKNYPNYLFSAKVSELTSKETMCKELLCQFSRL